LRDLGYVEGQTIVLEPRWEEGKADRYATLASDLARLNVDIIVAGTTPAALAAKNATATIPIVMAATGAGDPVELGLVASLMRPGGNITGLILQTHELAGKRLELLKEAAPGVSRVALLWSPTHAHKTLVKEHEAAARALGMRLQPLEVRGSGDFEGVFQAASRGRAGAVIMAQAALFSLHRARLAELALNGRLPTISGETGFAEAGGLMNYGPNIVDSWRRAATYVHKILTGVKAADLPVEQPTKFELVINRKVAKALGLTIPASLLLRADRVIE
jgi:putative ABC transport system substrate-binding protein